MKICLGIQVIFTSTLPLSRLLLPYLCLQAELFLDRKIINISFFLQNFPLVCEQDSSFKHFLLCKDVGILGGGAGCGPGYLEIIFTAEMEKWH